MLGIPSHKLLPTMGIVAKAIVRPSMTLQRHLACLGERRLHMKEVTVAQRKHGSRGKHLALMA